MWVSFLDSKRVAYLYFAGSIRAKDHIAGSVRVIFRAHDVASLSKFAVILPKRLMHDT
jgi:hypothetical protein